ncbi:hypothetical protein [Halarsenatibacter silvermanii]|uniref:Uncharacterized protein n=1 Tax=Halarsenatibacter silvermanii TaxID=321763 RepID=A0A1G9TB02_9FIRM|nr:hypothetical protein [Halarsenatibacter silvermanii]SDM44315.1 hypothetical protein SAMN04488692_1363 [Halarsenatibacter silvermanii]
MIPLLHLGMIFLGSTYGENPEMMSDKFIGGSPYGPSTIAGSDGSRQPAEEDLNMASTLAKRVARVARGLNQIVGDGQFFKIQFLWKCADCVSAKSYRTHHDRPE